MKGKVKFLVLALSCMLTLVLCCVQPVSAAEVPASSAVSVVFSFDSNGGTGTMENQTVQAQGTTVLNKNAFQRTGCEFTGWNTKANGTGEGYADGADVASLVTEANNSKTIKLYAQWKVSENQKITVKATKPDELTVSFKKNGSASGYEIQFSTKKNYKKATTVKAKKTEKKVVLSVLKPNTKYYVRVRTYIGKKNNIAYSDWSAKSIKTKKGSSITNTPSDMSIEADLKLNGKGSGCHAKLVIGNSTSAVSYGIQYDKHAVAPYTGKAVTLIENVMHNGAGGQKYTRPSGKSLKLGKTYHLMMIVKKNGKGAVYLDYKKIGSFTNKNLHKEGCTLRIEACARLTGDTVDATFSNLRCKWNGKFEDRKVLGKELGMNQHKLNKGLKFKYDKKKGTIRMYGKLKNVKGDWDSDYEGVSYVIQLY